MLNNIKSIRMIVLISSLLFFFTGCVPKAQTPNNQVSSWNYLFDSDEFIPVNKNQEINKKAM